MGGPPYPPRLRGHPVLGSMADLRRDYLGTVSRADRELGGLATIAAGPPGWRLRMHTVTSAELAAEVLNAPDRFGKDAPGYRELRGAIGDNLLTSQDAEWRRQRRLFAPLFTHRRIAGAYAAAMADEADRLVDRWRTVCDDGHPVDAHPELAAVAARVIGRILFGADVGQVTGELIRFRSASDALLARAVSPHPVPRWLPTPANRRLDRDLARVRATVDAVVAARAASPETGETADLVSVLVAGGQGFTVREVSDQATLFMLAGLETTAVTMAAVLVELALHPDWQQAVAADVAVAGASSGVLGQLVRETMRLFPAAHGMARNARGEQQLAGWRIPAGAWVEVSPWGVHHSASVWPEPGRFDPGRFAAASLTTAGHATGAHGHTWIPFGAGPRACIGMHLALLEIQTVLARVIGEFVVSTALTTVPVHAAITLQPTGAWPVTLRRR